MKSILFLLFVTAPAYAMNDSEFQQRTTGLNHQQRETEAMMRKMGVNTGFTMPTQNVSLNQVNDDSKHKPLFQIHSDFTSVRIPAGKLLYGRTLNRLVVGPEGAPVLIILDLEQGMLSDLRIMGLARQAGTEGRVSLELTRLLLRNGKVVAIQSAGLDTSGAYGVESQVFSGKAVALAGAMASSFISGFASSQQTQGVNSLGFSTTQPSGRNALLQGVAQTAADQGKRLIEDATSEKPILVVDGQTPVSILVQEEVRF
jgi:hypothetical protein